MNTNSNFQSTNKIRLKFTRAMSKMYQEEVPLYKKLLTIAQSVNAEVVEHSAALADDVDDGHLLSLEHHGAIRLGTAKELFTIRRLFQVMGMHPVEYYDLSASGIPVHSTAFRALHSSDLLESPFRIFCSLLRLDLVNKQLREVAEITLARRSIFSDELMRLIELCELQGGLLNKEADSFIDNALEVFRWHKHATVDKNTYDDLKDTHALIADVVSFKGPHINHLTPKVLDIDKCQAQFKKQKMVAKKLVEGPPRRSCPILLRQTSFIAIEESIAFYEGEVGKHSARFGEVEQRGIALTPKGRDLYDELLSKARNADADIAYSIRLKEAFKDFPDSYKELRLQNLGYFRYSATTQNVTKDNLFEDIEVLIEQGLLTVTPITYEDFLPVSAAGIFTSNLSHTSNSSALSKNNNDLDKKTSLIDFENSMGAKIISSFDLYEEEQQQSLAAAITTLGYTF